MKKTLQVLIICFFSCFLATTSWSNTDEIVVGISTGYPPYYYKHNGQFEGICIDIVNHIARAINLDVTYEQLPWKRLLFNAEHGHVDAIMPLFKTQDRERFLYFDSLDLAQEENRLFTWKGANIIYSGNLNDLTKHTIGVVADYSYGETFDQFEHFNKVVTKDDRHLLEMFKHGRFDIGIGNKDVILYNAYQENISDKIQFLDPHITRNSLYIGFSKTKKHGELAQKFSTALQKFKLTDAYKRILKKKRTVER